MFGNLFFFNLLAILSKKIAYCESQDHINDDNLQKGHEIYNTTILEAPLSLGIEITDLHCNNAHKEEEDVAATSVITANILF